MLCFRLGQSFRRQPAREINVDVILEVDRDIREPEEGYRTDLLYARQTGHRGFHGKRKEFLHILGSQARAFRIDVDLDRRDIGEGIDGHLLKRTHAERDNGKEPDQHQQPVAKREVDQFGEHGRA